MSEVRTHKPTWLMLRVVNLAGFFTCIIGAVILVGGIAGMAGKEFLTLRTAGAVLPDRSHAALDHALSMVSGLLGVGLALVVILIVRRLVESALAGDPFVESNVRRLRRIGLVLCVAYPVAELIRTWIETVLAERDGFSRGFPIVLPFNSIVTGLGVFVLAQVFAHGVALREDVEGTV